MASNYLDLVDATQYALQYKAAKDEIYKTTGNWEMHCRNTEDELYRLQRCGCPLCRDQYNRLRYEYRYHLPLPPPPQFIVAGIDVAKEVKLVENTEPKNYAVKLLVDQLKTQQSYLTSKKSSIDTQKQVIKNANEAIKGFNKQKGEIESKIKELSGALKKLGHKE